MNLMGKFITYKLTFNFVIAGIGDVSDIETETVRPVSRPELIMITMSCPPSSLDQLIITTSQTSTKLSEEELCMP